MRPGERSIEKVAMVPLTSTSLFPRLMRPVAYFQSVMHSFDSIQANPLYDPVELHEDGVEVFASLNSLQAVGDWI